MHTNDQHRCTVCASKDIYTFIAIEQVPVFCNVLLPTYEEAIAAQKANLRMNFCRECRHVFNSHYDPELLEYTQEYETSLDFSPRFQEYAKSLAHYLIDRYNLRGKDIIEIGCGKGEFLKLICTLGTNRGVGFDLSYEPARNPTDNNNVTFIQDYYSELYSHYKANLICCRHALEHIQFPKAYLENIRRVISTQRDIVVFFEVPNVLFTLQDLGIWDLIYEHCSYFSTSSLTRVFSLSGFEVLNLREVFEGQYLCVEARPITHTKDSTHDHSGDSTNLEDHVSTFEENYYKKVNLWKHKTDTIKQKNQRAVIWGSGSKGVTFLNIIKAQKYIEYAVDINPHKQGKYVPGTGQKIVPPEFLKGYRPDIIVIMNPIYQREIKQLLTEMNLSTELLLV